MPALNASSKMVTNQGMAMCTPYVPLPSNAPMPVLPNSTAKPPKELSSP